MSILVNGSIYCPCTNVSWSTTNVTTNLAEIVANLTLDPSVLSKTTRRYTSAPDDRTSSAAMGSFGIAIIVVFLGSIVLSDVPNLLSGLKQMRRNCVYFKKKLSHERSSRCSVGTLSNTAETTLTVSSDGE
ncbi:hypothetical protein DPMN_012737 [Dreissena polymorpha]|uniref:Uncharacterized protein n=1 Tax=Dreissena polymorpha TaxID=45954 RepID=A0A9D4N2Z2_DREPO|nr:hypothetical protein DPMN_012737 [Dreissena polymorpha]